MKIAFFIFQSFALVIGTACSFMDKDNFERGATRHEATVDFMESILLNLNLYSCDLFF